ncbi:hypothetical protein DIPPA_59551 [Diplonema papillatum]|nr:hypothetical protein DIPPA_59551 [Diplonema papillatum]
MMRTVMLGLSLLATPMLAANTSITVELEDYSIVPKFAPFVVRDDPSASGGKVIELPAGTAVVAQAVATDRQLEIVFITTEMATVDIDVHCFFKDTSSDSFFYSLDGGSYTMQNDVAPAVWDVYGKSYTRIDPGVHRLVLKARETEALMDKVVIGVSEGEITYAVPKITVELESLSSQSSFAPFVTESNANATGGEYIVLPSSVPAQLDPAQGGDGQVEVVFILTDTTDILIDFRVSFPTDTSRSFFYKVDGEYFQTLSGNQTGDAWVSLVSNFASLGEGAHSIYIKARETGVKLDSIAVLPVTGAVFLRSDKMSLPPTPQPVAPEDPSLPPVESALQHSISPICVLGLTVLCIGAVLF